jgi:hypothetical protein
MKKNKATHKRKKIPEQVETQVLVRCKYRCCLCYELNQDDGEKSGQIAHIDQDRSNNAESNLAFLCHAHHSRYDTKSLQSKGITEGVLRRALQKLLEHLRLRDEKAVTLTLTIDRDFETFTDQEYAEWIAEVSKAARTKGQITKLSVTRGSVKVTLELEGDDAVRLLQALEAQKLRTLRVTKIEYSEGVHSRIDVVEDFNGQLGTVTKEQALAIAANPDYAQNVLEDQPEVRLLTKDEFPRPGFGTLVLMAKEASGHWTLGRALVIPRDAVTSWPIDRPREMLIEFARVYGIPLPRFGNKKIVFDETVTVLYGTIAQALTRAFSFKRPEAVFYVGRRKRSFTAAQMISIPVGCKFGESYAEALRQRGFEIDIEKWRQREQIAFHFR